MEISLKTNCIKDPGPEVISFVNGVAVGVESSS